MSVVYRYQQLHSEADRSTNYQSLSNAVLKIAKEEGLEGLYSGLSSSLFGIAATNFVYYLFCESSYLFAVQD